MNPEVKNIQDNKEKKSVGNKTVPDYTKLEWYIKLSLEQQRAIDSKIEQKKDLEKKIIGKQSEIKFRGLNINIINKGLEKNKPLIEDNEDVEEIKSFEERVDMMERSIDRLSRELYDINLELNSFELTSSFDKSNEYFKSSLLKEGEKNESVLEIVKNKDLSNITAGEIYTLKQEGYDLSKLFLIGASEFSKDNMNVGDSFKVNFGGNESLNKNIGAGDLLAIDKIDKVKINGVLGERKLSPRPGYYAADGRYLAIFDNYSVEIVSKKDYTPEEKEQSISAFKDRYDEIRKPEVLYNLREQLKELGGNNEISLKGFSESDLKVIGSYLSKYLPEEVANNIDFDLKKGVIKSKTNESINEIINKFVPVENLGSGYEKYKDIVVEISAKYGIRPEKLITLINHENSRWDPMAGAPGSSAYGLGQMIDSTWNIYGKGLDRNNPKDQLDATCRYLQAIMGRQNCTVELAMAFYNTGEGIRSISNLKAQEYARLNPAIAKKIEGQINSKNYFIGAVSYYNDISFEMAKQIV